MKRAALAPLLSLALIAALAIPVSARQKGGGLMGGGKGAGGDLPLQLLERPEILEQVGITEDQLEKLRAMSLEIRKKEIRNRAELQLATIDLQELLEDDNPNVKKIDGKIEQIGALRTGIQKEKVHALLEAKKILTPEQIERLKDLARERMKERRERRPGMGGMRERLREFREGGGPEDFPPQLEEEPPIEEFFEE
ncbi:MAG: periplasmic heavy metal sensor [bacterium]